MFDLGFMPIDNLEENLIWEVSYSTSLIFVLTESKLYTPETNHLNNGLQT